MYGTRPDGIKIHFTEAEVEKIPTEQFVSVSVTEHMTPAEVMQRYGKEISKE